MTFSIWLKQRLSSPLPGELAHQTIWSYPRNSFVDALNADPPPRHCAVNILLKPNHVDYHVGFILRSDFGIHGGQLAFPGGKIEQNETRLACAERETWEEIGVEKKHYTLVGELSPVYIPPSNMLVFPFVHVLDTEIELNINSREISDFFWVSMDQLLPHQIIEKEHYLKAFDSSRVIKGIPIEAHFLWGATAMISQELSHLWMEFKNR